MMMKVLVADKIADSGIDKLRETYEVDIKTGCPRPSWSRSSATTTP